MIYLKAVEDEYAQRKHVILNDRYYDVKEEHRGKKRKFWIEMKSLGMASAPIRMRKMLCKLGRNEVSCDNWGEIISSKIGKQLDVNIIDYYLVEYEEDNNIYNGVLCGSYFVTDSQYEMSVKDLQTVYTSLYVDHDTLETNKPVNTVYSILDDLDKIIDFPDERKERVMKNLKDEMLIQCLFDYILAQSDRHWMNTTFLVYEKNGEVYITKADCYDNGNIAFLQRKFVSLQGISREIGKDPLNSPLLKKKMDTYVPMMGVKTSTVKLAPTSDGQIGAKMLSNISARENFIDEITDEILVNPKLSLLFHAFKNKFSMQDVVRSITNEGYEPPAEIIKLVNDIITYQVDSLDKVLNAKLDKLHQEDDKNGYREYINEKSVFEFR